MFKAFGAIPSVICLGMDLAPLRTWAAAIKLRKRPTLFSGGEAGAAERQSAGQRLFAHVNGFCFPEAPAHPWTGLSPQGCCESAACPSSIAYNFCGG